MPEFLVWLLWSLLFLFSEVALRTECGAPLFLFLFFLSASQLDGARARLAAEAARAAVGADAEGRHQALLDKVAQLNLLRESNELLRAQAEAANGALGGARAAAEAAEAANAAARARAAELSGEVCRFS